MARPVHIKSHDTDVSVARSRTQLEQLLARYGCSHFGTASDYESGEFSVFFRVRNTPADDPNVPVRLSVNVGQVERAMAREGITTRQGQAERVAWRNLYLWVDAACAAASVGLRPMAETFFADIIVNDDEGRQVRAFDLVGPHVARLALPAGTQAADV